MDKQALKLYALGLLLIIFVINIPETKSYLEEHAKIAQPYVQQALQLTYDNMSAAIVPLVGKITNKPALFINGKSVAIDTKEDFSLTHGQSLSTEQINTILTEARSPAEGTGRTWVMLGEKHHIDAAYALAIFIRESQAGTNLGAAKKPNGWTYNIGNLICSGYATCYNGFRDYSGSDDPWYAGIEATIQNLAYYRDTLKIKTFDEAIRTWAPPNENNTEGYIADSKTLIQAWRSTNKNILTKDAQALSTPITSDPSNDFGFNVHAALEAENEALKNVYIKNGEQWSFNETIGDPDDMGKLKTVSGQYGGGWCDLACRYVQVLQGLGLRIQHTYGLEPLPKNGDIVFIQHGGKALFNCSVEESPYIWSEGNKGFENGAQDLIINNNTGKTIFMSAVDNGDGTTTIIGKFI